MAKELRYIIAALLALLIILNCFFYYHYQVNREEIYNAFYFYNLFSVVTFALLFIAIIKVGGLFTIHTISSFFSFLFLYGRASLYIFEPSKYFFQTELIDYENIGFANMLSALVVSNVFIYSINVVYILFGKPDQIKLNITTKDIKTEQILFYLIFIFGALYSFKLFLEFRHILIVGYTAVYAGGLDNVNYHSPIVKYSHVVFNGFFSYYLLVVHKKRKFLLLASVFFVVSFLDSLKGARIAVILPSFFILWYYNALYTIKVSVGAVFKGILALVLLASFSIYSSSKRNSLEVDLRTNVLKSAIAETGSTLQVVGRYIKNKDQMNAPYPYFLEPIFYPYFYFRNFSVMTKGQSEEMLEHRNSLNHQFTAFVSKEAYLTGKGVGSSSAAEFFQYGLFLLIVFSVVYGFILVFFYSQLNQKVLIFLSTIVVLHVFFIARETPFPNAMVIAKGLFVYFLLKAIFSIKW
jgi:oligosaccharide repeat unit polymerase